MQHPLVVSWEDLLPDLKRQVIACLMQNKEMAVIHSLMKGYGGGGFEFGLDSRLIQSLSSFFEFTARFSSKTSLQKIIVVEMMLHDAGYEGGRFLILDARFLRALVKALPLLDSFVLVDAECWEDRSGYSISKDFTELKNDASFTLNVTLPHDAEDEDEEE